MSTINIQKVSTRKLEEACTRSQGLRVRGKFITAEACLAELLRRVGPAGAQALADEKRYFNTYLENDYSSRKQKAKNARAISFVYTNEDCSAMIVSIIDFGWFAFECSSEFEHSGGFKWKQNHHGPTAGLHHLSVQAYLVLRDSTSKERHIMRVPPRFGMYRSATFQHYATSHRFARNRNSAYTRNALIRAALAWSFNLDYADYCPDSVA